jgi:hypothetical protein
MASRHPKEGPLSNFESLILTELGQINHKVEESLEIGRENNREIKILRTELGLEGAHGRIPSLEAELQRLNARVEKQDIRVDATEVAAIESRAKHRVIATVIGVLSGGLGAAVFSAIIRYFGAN